MAHGGNRKRDQFGIDLLTETRPETGMRQTCGRVTCVSCGAIDTYWARNQFSSYAASVAFLDRGWTLGSSPKCKDCVNKRRNRGKSQSPLRLAATDGLHVPPPIIDPPKEETMSAAEQQPRPLTPNEKTKVRQKLDACFDEQVGFYLEGQSDQTIGIALNIPWACIRDYRELAYGPLKGNQEIADLRAELDKLTSWINDAMERSTKEIGDMAKQRDRISSRVEALAKKMGF